MVSLIFLKRSIVFPIILFSSISLHCSLKKVFFVLFCFNFSLLFSETLHSVWYISLSTLPFAFLHFSAIYKASSDNHFSFLHFFFLGVVLVTASCTMLWTTAHNSLDYQRKSLEFICQFHCVIKRDLISAIPEHPCRFPFFLTFKSEFCNKKLMIWITVSARSYFWWLYRAPFSSAKNVINLILVLTIWWCPCVVSSLVLLEEVICSDQCVLFT